MSSPAQGGDTCPVAWPSMQRIIRPRSTVDLAATLRPVSAGRGDPSVRIDNGEVWVATRSPSGPATLHFTGGGHRIEVEAWGPGGSDAIEAADGWVGAGDDPAGFEPGPLRALAHLHRGVRVTANEAVAEALLRVVPAQMVTSREAKRLLPTPGAPPWRGGSWTGTAQTAPRPRNDRSDGIPPPPPIRHREEASTDHDPGWAARSTPRRGRPHVGG